MKADTATLLDKFRSARRFKFVDTDNGLELEHDLTDEEKFQLVQAEYGNFIAGNEDALFVRIMQKMTRLTTERAKNELKDRLTIL